MTYMLALFSRDYDTLIGFTFAGEVFLLGYFL